LASGKLLWRTPFYHSYYENCVTPVQYKDLLIAAGRNGPALAFRLEKDARGMSRAKEVWEAKGLVLYYSSPVLAGDLLISQSGQKAGCLCCLNAKTGETLWESDGRQAGYATVLNARSVWLFLTDKGRLIVVKPSAKAYEPIAEYKVSDRQTWAHPVFLGDRILIRDDRTLRSFRIEPDGK
jgi:outer membrane protein assembly factor BamB